MATKHNFLLEYAIDTLLKNFNPERKPVMAKYHFFKLMNLLDTRLKKQEVDIKLPGYWYQYGFFIEIRFLDAVLPRDFSKFYMINQNNIVPPLYPRRKYDISDDIKLKIDSTVRWLWKKYGFKSNYGTKAKKESYEINAPYEFNTIFQEYIETANHKEVGFISRKESLEPVLDKLLSEFPETDFPELYDTFLGWDDTTRLVLDCVPEKEQYNLVKKLMDLFWESYSKGVRIQYNQNIPLPDISEQWKKEYEYAISNAYKQIENIRKDVLNDYYKASDKDEELVKKLMKKTYEMSVEA